MGFQPINSTCNPEMMPTKPTIKLDTSQIIERYASGKRDFEQAGLSNCDLRGVDLSYANLKGTDLSYADLKKSTLKGTNLSGANLKKVSGQKANLQGACLHKVILFYGDLMEANLSDTDLSESTLDGVNLRGANLSRADLSGTDLIGAELDHTNFQEAYYNEQTHFPKGFDPVAQGMLTEINITVGELINRFNELTQCSNSFLGNTMTAKYWESSRPELEWLQKFQINRAVQISFSGELNDPVTNLQLNWFRKWINEFIKYCSQIIDNFSILAEQKFADEDN